jgi:serine/threonine protein phosphatase PrpC
VAGRASIVGAAETSVGKVRDHNEDAHFIDPDLGIFLVCDGMGGHAAGEVASQLAVSVIRHRWSGPAIQDCANRWLSKGTLETRKELMSAIRDGVTQAHSAILAEAERDKTKGGMGTTLVGAILIGGDIMFAHAGDSRAYLVRDGIAMQLTEDHTLLARLLAAGVDVDTQGEGSRFKSMLTNALGIGTECKVSTFVVPVADGDRFLLCSDGITEYLAEAEIGEVLTKMPSPARSAQRLVELALQRGGGDNATALVVRVLEAGETARSADLLKREEESIRKCPLWSKVNPQQRLRALRIALPRDHADGEKVPAQTLGDRVAWVIVDGIVEENGQDRGPGSLLYPEALLADRPLPDKDGLAIAQGEVRALALRSDDFRELCEDDPELAEILLESLAAEIGLRRPQRRTGKIQIQSDVDARGTTLEMTPVKKDPEPEPTPAKVEARPRALTPVPEATPIRPITNEGSKPNVVTIPVKPNPAATPAAPTGSVAPDDPQLPSRTKTLVMRSPTSPPPAGAMLPNVQPTAHPKVTAPPRIPTPAGGVLIKTPTPPIGVPRPITPAKGIPSITKPAEAPRPITPANPVESTQPLFGAPKPGLAAPARDSAPRISRTSTPPTGLIVTKADREATEAAVDTAMNAITVDDSWDMSGPHKRPTIPPPLPPPEPEHGIEAAPLPSTPATLLAPSPSIVGEGDSDADEPAREITMEADEPGDEINMEADEPEERRPSAQHIPALARARALDESEPEISIERLEMEADEPQDGDGASEASTRPEIVAAAARSSRQVTAEPAPPDDGSQPEIQILRPGRAITSNQMKAVSGAISEDPKPPPRAKRKSDVPD